MQVDSSKAKYPHTQELVRHAREKGGYIQAKIARICGVTQSTVSDWEKGKKKAKLEQIKPLVEIFGDIVNHSVKPTYMICKNQKFEINDFVIETLSNFLSQARIEHEKTIQERKFYGNHMPDYRLPKRISDPELRDKFESEISRYEDALSLYDSVSLGYAEINQGKEIRVIEQILVELKSLKGRDFEDQDSFLELFTRLPSEYAIRPIGNYQSLRNDLLIAAHKYDSEIVQIEGDIIFQYTLEINKDDSIPIWRENDGKILWMKWIVHDLGRGRFCWLVQQPKNTYFPIPNQIKNNDLWLSIIQHPSDLEGILVAARSFPFSAKQKVAVDHESLIFFMTKAFIERGYAVKGVKIIQRESA